MTAAITDIWLPIITRDQTATTVCAAQQKLFPPPPVHSGTAVGHVCDKANTDRNFAEISDQVQPEGQAVILLDGTGWHRSNDLVIPATL